MQKISKGIHTITVRPENKNAGMYYLIYKSGEKNITYKLIFKGQN